MTYVLALERDQFASGFIMTVLLGMLCQMIGTAISTAVYGTESSRSQAISAHPRTMSIVNLIIASVSVIICTMLSDAGYEDDGVTKKTGQIVFVQLGFCLFTLFENPSLMYLGGVGRGWLVDMDVQRNSDGMRREALINGTSSCRARSFATDGAIITTCFAQLRLYLQDI